MDYHQLNSLAALIALAVPGIVTVTDSTTHTDGTQTVPAPSFLFYPRTIGLFSWLYRVIVLDMPSLVTLASFKTLIVSEMS